MRRLSKSVSTAWCVPLLSISKRQSGYVLKHRIAQTAEHGTTREKLVAAETSQSHLEERVRDLSLQVEAKEEKLALYEGRNAAEDASRSPEEQLQATVSELR